MTSQLTPYTGRDFPDPLTLIESGNLADSTKALYRGILLPIADRITDIQALTAYADNLSESRRRTLKSAVSLWVKECTKLLESQVTPETLAIVQATVMRLKALPKAIRVSTPKGKRAHTWLTEKQITKLYRACEDELMGLRDRVALGLMVTTGIRRQELVNLRWAHIVRQPYEGELCAVVSVVQGKGGKDRAIPLTVQMDKLLDEWAGWAGRKGYVIRSLGMAQDLSNPETPMSCAAIHNLVKKRGKLAGIPSLAPHDLRRTFAQAIWENTGDLLLVGALLGHSSIETTRQYLSLDVRKQREAVQVIKWGPGEP